MKIKMPAKIFKIKKLALLNVVIWTLFAILAFGSSMLIDVSKKCFGDFYNTQIAPLQKAVERITDISLTPVILAKGEDRADERSEFGETTNLPPAFPQGITPAQKESLLPRIIEGIKDTLFSQRKRISRDVSDEDIVIIKAKDRGGDLYGEPYSEGEREDMNITVIEAPSDAEGEKGPPREISPEKVVTPEEDSSSEADISATQVTRPIIIVGGGGNVDDYDLALLPWPVDDLRWENGDKIEGYSGELQLPPEIDPLDNVQVDEKETVEFRVIAHDANGNAIEFYVEGLPDGALFTDNGDGTADFSWIPDWSQGNGPHGAGGTKEYSITFIAEEKDGTFNSYPEVITIAVRDIYDPIEITDFTFFIDEEQVTFDGDPTLDEREKLKIVVTATGYRGREVTCELDMSQLEQWQQEEIASHELTSATNGSGEGTYYEFTFTWTPSPAAAKEHNSVYNVAFIFDDDRETAPRDLNITVNDIPMPPEISFGLSLVKEFEYPGKAEIGGLAYGNIARYGNYLIIANPEAMDNFPGMESIADLKVFDISDPRNPVHQNDYFIPPGDGGFGHWAYVYDMSIRGDLLYLYRNLWRALDPDWNTYENYCELKILDISDIENGNMVDVAHYQFGVGGQWKPNGFIDDGIIVILDLVIEEGTPHNDLKIIDVKDPGNPSEALLERLTYNMWQTVNGVFIEQDRAYVLFDQLIVGGGGLHDYRVDIFDILDMDNGNTSKIATYEFQDYGEKGIWVKGEYLYILIPEGLDILKMGEEEGTISFTPVASYYATDELEANIESFARMIADDSIIYLGVDGTASDNSEDGVITLNQENLLLGLDTELLRRNDDLRDDERFTLEITTPYTDIYYDEENMLLYGLRQKILNPRRAYVDIMKVGLVKEEPESDLASYRFNWDEDIEIRTVVEDPDRGPDPLNVWVEDLPDYLEYEFDDKNILTIRNTGILSEGVHDFTIYADDGIDEVSQSVRVEIIYPDGLHVISGISGLQQAINNANEGDTIALQPGTYTLAGNGNIYITKNITLVGVAGPDKTILNLGSYHIYIKDKRFYNQNEYYYRLFENLDNVTIDGITITGYRGSSREGAIQNYSAKLTLKNCKVIDNWGIKVGAIYNCWKSELHLGNTLVAGNRNYGKYWNGYFYSATTIWLAGYARLYVNNSTIANNINNADPEAKYGAIFRWCQNYLYMTNSIMWGNGNNAQDFSHKDNRQVGIDITYCDIQSPTVFIKCTPDRRGRYTSYYLTLAEHENINEDPQFVDSANGNYNIGEYSPCRDTGEDGADMGAYFE